MLRGDKEEEEEELILMRRKILFDCLKNIPYFSGSFSRLCYSQC